MTHAPDMVRVLGVAVLCRWEVLVGVSDGRFQQVSFVNSIATTKGGTHINYVVDQLCKHIVAVVSKVSIHVFVRTKCFCVVLSSSCSFLFGLFCSTFACGQWTRCIHMHENVCLAFLGLTEAQGSQLKAAPCAQSHLCVCQCLDRQPCL